MVYVLQATFDELTYIGSIITQGQNPGGGHVRLYRLEYTEDGTNWKPVNMVRSTPGVEQVYKYAKPNKVALQCLTHLCRLEYLH